jgi:hypothetical protein
MNMLSPRDGWRHEEVSPKNEKIDTVSNTNGKVQALLHSRHAIALLVFLVAFLIFKWSPLHPIHDSKYSMMLSQCLIDHRSFQLDHYAIPRLPAVPREDYVQNGDLYQLEQVGPHLYYFFPPGSSVLSVPFVLVANAFGISAVKSDNSFSIEGETGIEALLAALLMAVLAAVFFYTARLMLPPGYSLLATVGGALGTQIWSTASRAMFADTWAVLLLGIVIFAVLAYETNGTRLRAALVASLLAWAYFTAPAYAVHIAAISLYLLFTFTARQILAYALTGIGWAGGFIIYSWHNFSQLLPSYFRPGRLHFRAFWIALPGNLFSPSRGLLIFVPTILFVVYLLIRFRGQLANKRLVAFALAAIVAQLIVISGFDHWWGGHSYGPRLTTGLVPWCVLLAILGLKAMLASRENRGSVATSRTLALSFTGLLLLALSVFIHGRGAMASATSVWNALPANVDEQPARVWDWRQPQFLAGLLLPPFPASVPLLPARTRIEFTTRDAEKYLWYGWSSAETESRWTSATRATIVFSLSEVRPMTLQLKVAPFLVAGKLDEQRVTIKLNGQTLADLSLRNPDLTVYPVSLPADALRERNILEFQISCAASPASLGVGADQRQLGIRVASAELIPQ